MSSVRAARKPYHLSSALPGMQLQVRASVDRQKLRDRAQHLPRPCGLLARMAATTVKERGTRYPVALRATTVRLAPRRMHQSGSPNAHQPFLHCLSRCRQRVASIRFMGKRTNNALLPSLVRWRLRNAENILQYRYGRKLQIPQRI